MYALSSIFFLLGLACSEGEDTAQEPDPCAGGGDLSLTLGIGSGGAFIPFSDGDQASLVSAPQGGFGVSVWASSTGVLADNPVDVLLETEINGSLNGSFMNEGVMLYCQPDGTGLLWGVVVGFDPAQYPTTDDLLALDGEMATLLVEVTDAENRVAHGSVEVEIDITN